MKSGWNDDEVCRIRGGGWGGEGGMCLGGGVWYK